MKTQKLDNGTLRVTIPVSFVTQNERKRIHSKNYEHLQNCHSTLVANIAKGFYWQYLIDDGKYENIRALAEAFNLEPGAVAKCFRLTLLSPKIIHKIIIGDITINSNILREKIPLLWKDQEKLYLE